MPTPSKFVAARRERVLEILAAGGSRREAARAAGIDPATLTRWIARGAAGAPGGLWRAFHDAVAEAESHPTMRVLRAEFERMAVDPMLAWKFLERVEPGFGKAEPRRPT